MSEQCLFCLETTNEEKHKTAICNCQLSYHTPCYNKWNELKPNTCPICRKNYKKQHTNTNESSHLLIHMDDTIPSTNNIFSRRSTSSHHILMSNSENQARQQRTKKILKIILGCVVIILIAVLCVIICG